MANDEDPPRTMSRIVRPVVPPFSAPSGSGSSPLRPAGPNAGSPPVFLPLRHHEQRRAPAPSAAHETAGTEGTSRGSGNSHDEGTLGQQVGSLAEIAEEMAGAPFGAGAQGAARESSGIISEDGRASFSVEPRSHHEVSAETIAGTLERLARRVRSGEIRVAPFDGPAGEAAILAAALVELLKKTA